MSNLFKNIFASGWQTVREINQKYSRPRIQMTRGVKLALISLRLYLFVLIALMLYKFITALR